MAPHNLPPSRGARWRRKALSLASVAAIIAALTLSGGASASADDGTTTTETSAVQTTDALVEPAPEEEVDPTSEEAPVDPTSEDPVQEDVVDETPISKIPDPAPEPESDPAPEQDVVEEEEPAAEPFAQLLVADPVAYSITVGSAVGECTNPGVNQSGFWDVRVSVDPDPGFNWHVFAAASTGIGDASAYNTSGTTTVHLVLGYGATTYAVTVYTNEGALIGSDSVTIPSCITAPPVVTIVDVPAQPGVNDPDGLDNATWNVPSDDDTFTWAVDGDGHLIVTIIAPDTTFPGGATTHDYGIAPDSGVVTPKKVWVCKYVGKPGEDERLKEGKNPISVSVTGDEERVPGTYFEDAQGRSYVLAFDDGGDAPDVSECPGPDGPPEVTVIELPATPAVTDPCGLSNATWNVPTDTDVLDWTLGQDGHLVVTIIAANTTFTGGATTHDYGLAVDSGVLCPPEIVKIPVPAQPAVTDPCGSNNATWVKPADTDQVSWSIVDGHLIVTVTAKNTEFTDGTTTHDYGIAPDSGVLCPVYSSGEVSGCDGFTNASLTVAGKAQGAFLILGFNAEGDTLYNSDLDGYIFDILEDETVNVVLPAGVVSLRFQVGEGGEFYFRLVDWVKPQSCDNPEIVKIPVPAQPAVTDPCGSNNATWVKPADTDQVSWSIVDGHLIVTVTAKNTEFTDGTTTHDYGIAPDSNDGCIIVPPVVVPPVVVPPAVVPDVPPASVVEATVDVTVEVASAAVDAAPAVVDDVYPTDSHNGGDGERFPVRPLLALFVVLAAALIVAVRRGVFATSK